MTGLPEPLTPAEADLQGYGFMPLYGHRLFGSDFNALCNDAEWRAGVTLWWAAWNQVPAGSLPDDDLALARLADLGRDLRRWRRLRANALRGFIKCSDGRLYHAALAPLVIEAWARRSAERRKKQRWRDKQRGHGPGEDGDGTVPSRSKGNGKERTGISEAIASAEQPAALADLALVRSEDDWSRSLFGEGLAWLARVSATTPAALRPLMGRWLKAAGDDHKRVFDLLASAEGQAIADPRAWITAQLGGKSDKAGGYRNGFVELVVTGEV